MKQTTKIVLAWELSEEGIPKAHIAKQLDVHRKTVGIWIGGIAQKGLGEFLEAFENAKKGERKKDKWTQYSRGEFGISESVRKTAVTRSFRG